MSDHRSFFFLAFECGQLGRTLVIEDVGEAVKIFAPFQAFNFVRLFARHIPAIFS